VSHSTYLKKIFDPTLFKRTVRKVVKKVREIQKTTPFNAIAFTGQSGAAMAYPVACKTELFLICVRKVGEKCHGQQIESANNRDIKNYIIIDDLMGTGATVMRIREQLKEVDIGDCVGIVLYDGTSIRSFSPPVYHIN